MRIERHNCLKYYVFRNMTHEYDAAFSFLYWLFVLIMIIGHICQLERCSLFQIPRSVKERPVENIWLDLKLDETSVRVSSHFSKESAIQYSSTLISVALKKAIVVLLRL